MGGRVRVVMIRETPLEGLARLVTHARQSKRDNRGKPLSKPKAAQAIGLSRQTLDNVERGLRAADLTYAQLEQFFEWPAGSILNFLDHDGPDPAPASEQPVVEERQTDAGRAFIARVGPLSDAEAAVLESVLDGLRKRNI